MNLKNKTAIVTGASDGIGKEIVLALAKEKVNLVLVARNEVSLSKVKKEALKIGSPKVRVYPCDIRRNLELEKIASKIKKDFKKVDILLNVAGIWLRTPELEKTSSKKIEEVVNTNLTGLIYMTRVSIPLLRKKSESAIINISSRAGFTPEKGISVYVATKYGVRGFTDVLKTDLKDTNIRVAGVYQGGTNTKMFKKAGDIFEQKHFINPKDLANVIVFMLSQPPQTWLHDVRVEY